MLIGVFNQEFLQHNANRSYPLSEQATKQPTIGTDCTIPDNFLVAAKIVLNATPNVVAVDKFYIRRLTVYNGGVSILIGYDNLIVGSVTAADTGQRNTTFPIEGLNSFYGLTGHITIGTFEQLKTKLGDYTFDLSGSRFDTDVINYSPAAVTSITIVENGVAREPIYGAIKIVAGDNMSVKESNEGGHTKLTITREESEFEKRRCIKTIKGVAPDANGNLGFESISECLQISETAHGLRFDENCCEPCCGCEELESLNVTINNILQSNNEIRMCQQKIEQQLLNLTTTLNITGV